MAVALASRAAVMPTICGIWSSSIPGRTGRFTSSCSVVVRGFGTMPLSRLPFKRVATESNRPLSIVGAKAEGQAEITEVQAALEDFIKKAQESWGKVDDKLAVGGLGVAALIVLWGSTGLISAIDKLPLIPQFLEIVGLLFTGWFIYRYLLFKPDREELLKLVDDTKAKITGQDEL